MKQNQAIRKQGFELRKPWLVRSSAAIVFLTGCGSEAPEMDDGAIAKEPVEQSVEAITVNPKSSTFDQSTKQVTPELTGGMTLPDDLGSQPPVTNKPETIDQGYTLPE